LYIDEIGNKAHPYDYLENLVLILDDEIEKIYKKIEESKNAKS
jgi:hypothetical protein